MTPGELMLGAVEEESLGRWLLERRWFGSKARDVANVHVLDIVELAEPAGDEPGLVLALAEARFPAGTHDVYQLVLATRPADQGWERGVVADAGGVTFYDAFEDPQAALRLAALLGEEARRENPHAVVIFRWAADSEPPPADADVRPVGAEQSNTSVVYGDAFILKAFRRLEAGDNPELEMLRFLSERRFPNIARLTGWYEYRGEPMDATLGVVQRFIPCARDGWEIALEDVAASPDTFPERMYHLGHVIGRMHTVLGSDATDPAFAPEEPGDEALSLLTATIDEEIERVFVDLPQDDPALAPIAGRGEEIRDRLRLLSHVGTGGRLIRHHGDLHLGQTLLAPGQGVRSESWIVLDFEGEPARALIDRRRKRSPLRDVAGMLRSFAYVASASELQNGIPAPAGWEQQTRERFLNGYFEAIETSLLPPGRKAAETLLSIFELEKAVYELRYELNNRPDWVGIPVVGILRLLEEPVA